MNSGINIVFDLLKKFHVRGRTMFIQVLFLAILLQMNIGMVFANPFSFHSCQYENKNANEVYFYISTSP